jgi:CTP:molybdopterin cytidylyltransferase MocA
MPPEPRPVGAVAALILAAGQSRRFGSAKQLARLEGRTLLEHVVARAAAAGLRPVLAVVPPWLDPPSVAGEPPLLVANPHPERGLSHSLRLGLAALPSETDAAVILLGDQPTIEPGTIGAVLAARGDRPVVAAFAEGHAAPPVLLERSAFGLADGLEGDVGLRDLIAAHPDLVRRVPVAAHAPDLDRPEDLAALARSENGHGG